MNVEITGTLVGYDADSGEKLFTEVNRLLKAADKTSTLPLPEDSYFTGGKNYRVVGVRRSSTEAHYEIDVKGRRSELI